MFEEEIQHLKEYIEKLKKESKFQLSEIKLLDNQNKVLVKENVNFYLFLGRFENSTFET